MSLLVEKGFVVDQIDDGAVFGFDPSAIGGRIGPGIVAISSDDPGMYDNGRLKYGLVGSCGSEKGDVAFSRGECLFSNLGVKECRFERCDTPFR